MAEIRAQVTDTLSPALDRALPRILADMDQAVTREGLRLQGRVQRLLKDLGIYDTGELRKSVHTRTVGGATWVAATVATNTNYALNVHEGRRPGTWVPIAPLVEWVRRRIRQGRMSVQQESRHWTGKAWRYDRPGARKRQARKVESIAYAIRAKIHARGQQARPFMDSVFRANERDVRSRLERALVRSVRQAVNYD